MPAVSSNSVPPIFPRCPTCHKKMVFISVTPTCESTIYGYMCKNDGDRLSWECRQSHQQKVVRSELRQTSLSRLSWRPLHDSLPRGARSDPLVR